MYLTNDLSQPTMWQIPSGTSIAAGGYLLFYADGQTSATTASGRHTSFTLSASGGSIGLFATDGITPIDTVTYGAQAANVSYGRAADGSVWGPMATPTLGTANGTHRQRPCLQQHGQRHVRRDHDPRGHLDRGRPGGRQRNDPLHAQRNRPWARPPRTPAESRRSWASAWPASTPAVTARRWPPRSRATPSMRRAVPRDLDRHRRPADDHGRQQEQGLRCGPADLDGQLLRLRQRRHVGQPHDAADALARRPRRPATFGQPYPITASGAVDARLHDQLRRRDARP